MLNGETLHNDNLEPRGIEAVTAVKAFSNFNMSGIALSPHFGCMTHLHILHKQLREKAPKASIHRAWLFNGSPILYTALDRGRVSTQKDYWRAANKSTNSTCSLLCMPIIGLTREGFMLNTCSQCPLEKKEARSSYSEVIMFLYIVHQQSRFASLIDSF